MAEKWRSISLFIAWQTEPGSFCCPLVKRTGLVTVVSRIGSGDHKGGKIRIFSTATILQRRM